MITEATEVENALPLLQEKSNDELARLLTQIQELIAQSYAATSAILAEQAARGG